MDFYTNKTVNKVKRLDGEYRKFLYNKICELDCEISEIPAPEDIPKARSQFSSKMPENGWRKVKPGDKWGGEFCYAWIRSSFKIGKELDGKKLLLKPDIGLVEGLLFIDSKASGIFDQCHDIPCDFRLHDVQPLTFCAKAGETFDIAVECYAGHKVLGTRPYENGEVDKWSFYPANFERLFSSFDIVERDETVAEFLRLHRIVKQIIDTYPDNSAHYSAAINAFCEVFKVLPLLPAEISFDWHPALKKANEILRNVTDKKETNPEEYGYIGLIGHSHLDTAWLWPVREGLH
ncbi:MAG: hypothetical protein IKI68_03615 [Clostridia bacterium]|nr:hypothetical protein [Clostridia bacterium]